MPTCISHHCRCSNSSHPGLPRRIEHTILVHDFASYEAAKCATAKFIREAVDETWYRDLHHDQSFYMHTTAKQLLSHLDNNCGGLHPSELVNLPPDMLGFHATPDGIPEYINMLEAAQRKLMHTNLPTAVLASYHFPCPTNDWEARPHVIKTWTEWKMHYCATHFVHR